jgi:hypothetical protein
MNIVSAPDRMRQAVDIVCNNVKESPQQAMSRDTSQCTNPKAAIYPSNTCEDRFGRIRVGTWRIKFDQ